MERAGPVERRGESKRYRENFVEAKVVGASLMEASLVGVLGLVGLVRLVKREPRGDLRTRGLMDSGILVESGTLW